MAKDIILIVLIFFALQRVSELILSKKHEKKLVDKGAELVVEKYLTLMKLMHVTWFVVCFWGWRNYSGEFDLWSYVFLAMLGIGQALRFSSMLTLGERWAIPIYIFKDQEPIRSGLYKYFRHPNYFGVILEVAAMPALLELWPATIIFSGLNFWILVLRMSKENENLYDKVNL